MGNEFKKGPWYVHKDYEDKDTYGVYRNIDTIDVDYETGEPVYGMTSEADCIGLTEEQAIDRYNELTGYCEMECDNEPAGDE